MADRPNERVEEGGEQRADANGLPVADSGDIEPQKPKASIRWVQLAYELEHYVDPDANERGEVF